MGPYVNSNYTISDDDYGMRYVGSSKERQLHRKRKKMMKQLRK